jgi:hypothetical protein
VENLRASSEDLVSRITLHYREQVIYQIHRVLGSIDILGNPVGLFNTLSSGVGELFYEPYQGFIMSDRPQDLGIGIAKVGVFQIILFTTVSNLYLAINILGCWRFYDEECLWYY